MKGVRVSLRVRGLAPGIMNRVMTGEEFRGGPGLQCCVDLSSDRRFGGENGGTAVRLIVGQGEAVLFHQFCSCQLTTGKGASLSKGGGSSAWRWRPIRPARTLRGHGSSRNASYEETGMTESPVLQGGRCGLSLSVRRINLSRLLKKIL